MGRAKPSPPSFMSELKNYGLLLADPKPTDYILGGASSVINTILSVNRDYTDHIPIAEMQSGKIETMACVTFSALDDIETLSSCKFGEKWNKSDRFTAKQSGTTSNGNYLTNVGDSIRKNDGVVDEIEWPYDTANMDWPTFYKDIPVEVVSKGKAFLEKYLIQYEWVLPSPANFWEALQYGPIQVTVNSNSPIENGIIQPHNSTRYNHAVLMFKAVKDQYYDILDHYANSIKRYAWNYDFGPSLKYSLEKKFMKLVKSNSAANKTVYLLDAKGYRRAFYDEQHFNSVAPILGLAKWKSENGNQTDWSQVQTIDESELVKYPLGRPMFVIE